MREALAEFHQLKAAGRLTPEVALNLATRATSTFLERFNASGDYSSEAIALLCELATQEDPSLAQIGVYGLFPLLVERLGDAFTPEACAIYNRLFVQVIQHCRKRPEGAALDHGLRHFGLFTEADLLARAMRVRELRRFDRRRAQRVNKAFVLSRVTLGADIAVTSVALAALKEVFPAAEIGLVANAKALQLFAGDPRVRLCAIEYPRGGGLVERLASWLRTVECLQQQLKGLEPAEYVIVDPDSRLTQLGLLPLMANDRAYFFFESRRYCAVGVQKIGALMSHWLQQVLGLAKPVYPYCAPSPQDIEAAQAILGAARCHGAKRIVSMNLGVGANPAKRLPDPFEFRLLTRLLSDGATVILDKGGEPEEAARIDRLVAALRDEGFSSIALDDRFDVAGLPSDTAGVRLLTWEGGIGRFAALIAESEVYIGYDSAGQHIAAALGVPTIDIFTGFTSPRMPERWAPYGRGPVQVLVFNAAEPHTPSRLEAIVDDVLSHIPQG
jgi:ADP-heptose:LPS heptosyltransferase